MLLQFREVAVPLGGRTYVEAVGYRVTPGLASMYFLLGLRRYNVNKASSHSCSLSHSCSHSGTLLSSRMGCMLWYPLLQDGLYALTHEIKEILLRGWVRRKVINTEAEECKGILQSTSAIIHSFIHSLIRSGPLCLWAFQEVSVTVYGDKTVLKPRTQLRNTSGIWSPGMKWAYSREQGKD